MEPRAVTGLGVVTAVGIGREAFFAALCDPKPLADRTPEDFSVESFDASPYPNAKVAEVAGFDPARYLGDKGLRTLDRLTKLLVVAARLAMHDAGFKQDGAWTQSSSDRVGIVCSNAYGSLEAITEMDRVAQLEDARYINPAKFPNTVANSASGYASIWEGLRALNVAVSDGNCGALDAVGVADIHLSTYRADAILVGGAEAMSEAIYLAFRRLGALEGALLGEGAALLAVEPLAHARDRGASVLCEILGYGTAFEFPDDEDKLIHASQEAMVSAILTSIADAEIDPSTIDVVAGGLGGLKRFDDAEIAAIHRAVGRDDIPIAAPKFLLGETLGASGAMGMAAACAWFEGAAPSPIVRGRLDGSRIKTVLVTSMGFYGNASAVILRKSA